MTRNDRLIESRPTQNAWGPLVQVALEQRYAPDHRIIDDPLAYRLLPAYLKLMVAVGGSSLLRGHLLGLMDRKVPGIVGGILCRKRAIEERLYQAMGQVVECVVDLGAGMDTRAARQPPDSTVIFYEVDLPETIAAKAAALRRVYGEIPPQIRLVATDLERDDIAGGLAAAGYIPGRKVFFIMEGVTQYISEAAVRRLLEETSGVDPGSGLAFTYIRQDFIEGRELWGLETLYHLTRERRTTWKFGLEPDAVSEFIAPFGWRKVGQLGSAEYLERYVRPAGRDMPVMAVEQLVFAEKVSYGS